MFAGTLPHEHGSYRYGDSVETPLISELSERGYTTYGVSANGFASQRTGFHEEFDSFRYTGGRDRYLDGLDVSGTAQGILRNEEKSYRKALTKVLKKIPSHDHKLKSLANLLAVSCGEMAMKFEALQRIPHPVFAPTSDYSYTPKKNTLAIEQILEGYAGDDPFFIFTNYMDTHRCYKPPEELQKKHLGRSLGYNELVRLNEEVAAPWAFEEKKEREELDDADLEAVRALYAGEVETIDSHLKKLHETLETEGLLEETLIVITADHGENLGEIDEIGRQRMGHEASVSEAVLRVPLVVAHPNLTARTVSETVSLKDLYELFVNPEPMLNSGGKELPGLVRDEPTASQYPPKGGTEETIEKYRDASPDIIRHALSDVSTIAYDEGWKVVAESTGKRWAGKGRDKAGFLDAPKQLHKLTENHLEMLSYSIDDSMSDEQVSQLEALGYI
jgi:arylsulfatase A-like enzyme